MSDDAESVESRHLHVEQEQIDRDPLQHLDRPGAYYFAAIFFRNASEAGASASRLFEFASMLIRPW